jgi:hypothetical protein
MAHAHTQCMYTQCMHVSISMRVGLHRRTDRRCGPAAHTRTCCVRARACVRVRSGAHASAPAHASACCRCRPRVARRAGVPVGGGVQREHRRVEHRVSHHVVRCMRRLFGPARRATWGGTRSAGWSMRRGPLCAAGPPMRARWCVRRSVGTRMRGCARV